MKRQAFALVFAVLLVGTVWSTPSFAIPMVITGGSYTPESGDARSISGVINFLGGGAEVFSGWVDMVFLVDGLDPVVDTNDFNNYYSEISWVYEDRVEYYVYPSGPDPYGRNMNGWMVDVYYAGEYEEHCRGIEWDWPCAWVSGYEALHLWPRLEVTGLGTIRDVTAEAIQYDAMVTTRSWVGDPSYTTEMTLGRTIGFDYWWEMYGEPPPYQQGYMFDVLALQGGEGWQYIGQIDTYGSSRDWGTTSLAVPENLWGTETEVRFVLNDYSPETRPVVYLRDVRTGPVPEPPTVLMLGFGLIGFLALRRRFRRNAT
jgi:hypothetical protein